jgi:hypothetical protein
MPSHCQCGIELKCHHDPNAQPDLSDIGDQAEEGQTPVPVPPPNISMETIFRLIQQQQQQQTKWDPEKHTIEVPPDSYGTIFFDGFGQEASRKAPVGYYVLCADSTLFTKIGRRPNSCAIS